MVFTCGTQVLKHRLQRAQVPPPLPPDFIWEFFVKLVLPRKRQKTPRCYWWDLDIKRLGNTDLNCCIFQPAFGCCVLQALVEIVIFSVLTGKSYFFRNKTVDQGSGANSKNLFFAKICCKFLAFFRFFAAKMLKMNIWTSVRSAQHLNAGRNIQH